MPVENNKQATAWIAIDRGDKTGISSPQFTLVLEGQRQTYQAIKEGDWLLVLSSGAEVIGIGRLLRLRSDTERTTLYFDKFQRVDTQVNAAGSGLALPSSGSIGRLQWTDFVEFLPRALNFSIGDVPLISDHAYIREL